MAKVCGSQDKLDTDSSVSVTEERMDILHQDQNHDKRHLEVQKWLSLPPKQETCKQQWWELSRAARSATQEQKNPSGREG